jgi:transglutaminase-like putative cysteine protease
MTDLEPYLKPTKCINSDHERIGEILNDLGVTAEEPPEKAATKIFYFVRDRVKYNPYFAFFDEEDYVATNVLARGGGYCVQKAVVMAALARRAKIPCMLVFADIKSHIVPKKLADLMKTDIFAYHGYCALHLKGRWIKAAPTFDIEMCDKMGYLPVEFDGTKDAILHPVDRHGNKHIEYLREIGTGADVPFDDIKKTFYELYVKDNPKIQAMLDEAYGKP